MSSAPKHIVHAERLTSIFGYWPSFHDSEVLEFNLSRSANGRDIGGVDAPIVTAKLYVFEMTREVTRSGHFVLRHRSFVTLRFEAVDDLELDNLNHQNALMALIIEPVQREGGEPQRLSVVFEPAYGLDASFTCGRAEVVAVEACEPRTR